jgi:hypothetical protein
LGRERFIGRRAVQLSSALVAETSRAIGERRKSAQVVHGFRNDLRDTSDAASCSCLDPSTKAVHAAKRSARAGRPQEGVSNE